MGQEYNYYNILGIAHKASSEEIKQAYRALAKKYHPDLNNAQNASAFFGLIQIAYDVLSDENKRKLYDDELLHKTTNSSTNEQSNNDTYKQKKGTDHHWENNEQSNDDTYNQKKSTDHHWENNEPSDDLSYQHPQHDTPIPLSGGCLLVLLIIVATSTYTWYGFFMEPFLVSSNPFAALFLAVPLNLFLGKKLLHSSLLRFILYLVIFTLCIGTYIFITEILGKDGIPDNATEIAQIIGILGLIAVLPSTILLVLTNIYRYFKR